MRGPISIILPLITRRLSLAACSSQSDHKNLVEILGAFIKRDGLLAGKLMVDTAKHARATDEDVKIFCDGIERICTDDLDNNFLEKVRIS